jgi:ureidoglycolate lyase
VAGPDAIRTTLRSEPLTPETFGAFGDVIDASRPDLAMPINQGYAERFGDLARLDTTQAGGRPMVSLYRARACALPLRLRVLERHRLGSQAFMPLGLQTFLVIVGTGEEAPRPDRLRVFRTLPGQGVNLARGVWHHPLAALEAGDFLVIERAAPDGAADCDEVGLSTVDVWVEEPN